MNRNTRFGALIAGLAVAAVAMPASAQSFMLDDFPQAPLLGFPGFGAGAESPWGFPTPPGAPSGPSPVIPTVPGVVVGDGDIIGVGPVTIAAPALPYMASLSSNTNPGSTAAAFLYQLHFSVDRISTGTAGSAVQAQTTLNQQPGDIFRGGSTFVTPLRLISTMATLPAPFAGVLPSVIGATPSNALVVDESALGLPADASGVVLGPAAVAAPLAAGTHNNVDGFDFGTVATAGLFTGNAYQTAYPDLLIPFGIPTADIFDIAPGSTTFCGFPAFAATASMGLIVGDVIDALVVFDTPPVGSAACGGPGAQPGVDGVLFSLAPGSPSLFTFGLNAGDVFFSDFSGNFGTYASAPQLGLRPNPGGLPATARDNVDALEFGCLGDLNRDGIVNFPDVAILSTCLTTQACADFDANGVTDNADIALFASNLFCTGG